VTRKVLITGSRDFEDGQTVLDAITAEQEDGQRLIVIHGAARGADTLANTVGNYLSGVLVASVPADWEHDGYAAGPIRNAAMLEFTPDVVLAFYQQGAANRGTQNCVDAATRLGIPVKKFESTTND
jgi:hypothetical protein